MLKKIFLVLGILILIFMFMREVNKHSYAEIFLVETIGSNQIKYVKLLDTWSEDDFTGDGFLQVYIYKIKDLQKIKCDFFNDYDVVEKLNFSKFEEKYLNLKKRNYCQKIKIVKDTTITVIIQNNILIIRRISSSIPKKSYSEFKEYIDGKNKIRQEGGTVRTHPSQ